MRLSMMGSVATPVMSDSASFLAPAGTNFNDHSVNPIFTPGMSNHFVPSFAVMSIAFSAALTPTFDTLATEAMPMSASVLYVSIEASFFMFHSAE